MYLQAHSVTFVITFQAAESLILLSACHYADMILAEGKAAFSTMLITFTDKKLS